MMWLFLLPQFGPYTRLAGASGYNERTFLPNLILPTLIVIVIWNGGYNMTILYTALKSCREVVEAR